MGVVPIRQTIFSNRPRAADAFGDVLPGHFDVDAAGVGAFGLMHLEELLHLIEDLREVTGLVATAGLDRVAVHRIGTPQHVLAFALHGADQLWQVIANLVRTHARDQVQAAGVVVRVQSVDQANQVFGVHAWPDLDPNRVVHTAQELDVGAVQLPGAVADPQHVRRTVVILVGQAVAADEGLFVIQQQRFVGREETGLAQLWRRVHATGAHEGEGFIDAVGQLAVLLGQCRVGDEIQVPLMHLVQIGEAALGERAQQVQGRRGLVIGLQQAIWVRHPAFLIETDAIDDIATVGGKGHTRDGFIVGRARLGELPGHAPDFYHRAAGGEGHHDRHLQQHFKGVANFRRRELDEALRAIAALQQERAALGYLGKLPAQLPRFTGKHQRRITGQRLLDVQ